MTTGDFDDDGNLDFVTIGNSLSLGNGDGTFQPPVPLIASCTLPTCSLVSVAASDLNHDGWADLVLTLGSGSTVVEINNQQGGFVQTTLGSDLGLPAFADLNGDGNLDIVFAGSGSVYLGDGQGRFTFKETLHGSPFGGYALVADINGDGVPDVELAGDGTTALLIGNGDGTFKSPIYLGIGPHPDDIFALDLHGQSPNSGLPDLVFPDNTGIIVSLINKTN